MKAREFLKTLVHYGRVDKDSLMLSLVMKELDELERLAKIGKATEYLLNCRYPMALATKEQINCTEGGICITDVDSVIDLYDGLSCGESEDQ